MKKLFALILVMQALLFAGCGGTTTDSGEEGTAAQAETTQAAEASPSAESNETAEAAVSPSADATAAGAAVSDVQKALGQLDQTIAGLGQSIEVLESVE